MTHAIIIALYFRLNIRSMIGAKIERIFENGKGAAKSVAVFLFFLQFSKEKFLYSSSWIEEKQINPV